MLFWVDDKSLGDRLDEYRQRNAEEIARNREGRKLYWDNWANETLKSYDIPEGSRVYWFIIQTRKYKLVGISGDPHGISWKVPQSQYEVIEGPLSSPADAIHDYFRFPSLSPDPKVALDEYKAWESSKHPEWIVKKEQ